MKRIILIIFAFMTAFITRASAADTEILYYDVSAYINNRPIPCYNINGYCGIYTKDLRNYGFNVDYDEQSRTVSITRNKDCTDITGIDGVKLPWQKTGTVYAAAEDTRIRVLLDGKETPSYCAGGSMMILLDNLYPYGRMFWSDGLKTLFLTLEDLPVIEYAPLEKAEIRRFA